MLAVILALLLLVYACMNVGVEYGAFIGVIVFVGALALIYMLIADEVKKEDAKNKPREDWATKVIDIELESKISYRRKHHDSDKELVEEAREIYFAEISPDAKQFCSELNYEDIILAKHGKLPRSVGSWMGFSISDPGYSYSQEDARRIIREQHKFVRWVDEQLRKFGTREDLYFSYDDWHYFPAMEAIDTECGKYKWGPIIPDNHKFKSRAESDNAIRSAKERK